MLAMGIIQRGCLRNEAPASVKKLTSYPLHLRSPVFLHSIQVGHIFADYQLPENIGNVRN